ncbi:solute carrier family 25 (mitochondrial citrate transporter), member 1 [Entomortierella parvispora]|uniref:Solute carrier family 25 (Mitochondrial citrate transporter), member 1 n=1 Tax=Entomortierella parvispora TaxID=205924 RepID=A0A9P3H9Q1_9FUNG|nr:solute carrier family 25 (mitochondrial citrate transporter), member 1 [Entomortierella parvispora]
MATKRKDPALYTLTAGSFAGAIEATITYPTEFVKTQLQLQDGAKGQVAALPGAKAPKGPIDILVSTVRNQGISAVYRGLSAMIIGNTAKAGVRFFAFDQFKELLKDSEGKTTGARSVLAGLGAGMTEALLVVTPSETIKTKLIHDGNSAKPQYRGLVHGVQSIVKAEGLGGIYRGVIPVMARQGANSAVRFGVYSALNDLLKARLEPGAKVPAAYTFGIGAIAGIVTVYSTMPLDVVKTKMQGLNAKQLYNGVFDCFWKVFKNEGLLSFWKGATPRLARLSMSGGIVFSIYENTMVVLRRFDDPAPLRS